MTMDEDGPGGKHKELLTAMQDGIPLTRRPFKDVADELGWTEQEVISTLKELEESGYIRKFGAVLSPKKMGFVALLAAMDIPDEKVESAAEVINAYPGVTHNYVREGRPNIWFTLTEPDQETLDRHLGEIEEKLGSSVTRLPMTRLFKIGVKLDI